MYRCMDVAGLRCVWKVVSVVCGFVLKCCVCVCVLIVYVVCVC